MMRRYATRLIITVSFCISITSLQAQSADSLIAGLWKIHNDIKSPACNNKQVVSNRSMNIYLSDRIGYYLGGYKDLSLYKNNITYNSGDGIFSLNHNLFQPSGLDEPVKSFMVVGVKANAANAYAASFSNKAYTNELGVTIKKSWISKPVTSINNCIEKNISDISREQQLIVLAAAIKQKEAEFISSLAAIKNQGLDDSIFSKIKNELTHNFSKGLKDEYNFTFAEQQYRELALRQRFKSIALHWTNVSVYLPVLLQRFIFAESFAAMVANKRAYPFEVSVNHSRFWETKKYGRFLLTLDATAFSNNSAKNYLVQALSFQEYKNAGGVDTLLLAQRNINSIYVGNFKNFITTALKLNIVYFPHESHIGISSSIEQHMGDYKALNFSIGIPVVLIDKTTAPAANFEFRVNCFDITHKVYPGKKFGDNVSVCITVGVPFSKIVY